jgi:Ca2+-binding EF-hand superfamily protein
MSDLLICASAARETPDQGVGGAGLAGQMAADDDLLWLEAFFERKDSDGDGTLGNDEVVVVLKALGLDGKPEHVRSLFERFDTDRSGQISFDEFAPFVKFL